MSADSSSSTVVLVLCLVCLAWAGDVIFPVVDISSARSHYEAGKIIGSTFGQRIQTYLQNSSATQDLLLRFYNTTEGRAIFNAYYEAGKKHYPEYIQEMEGLADGSGIQFEHILLLNFQFELSNFASSNNNTRSGSLLSCTDIHVHLPDYNTFLIGHNEDGDCGVRDAGYFIDGRGSKLDDLRFFAFAYPGCLPGNAFGFNEHGLTFSTNALFPVNVRQYGIVRAFINRHMLGAHHVQEVLERITVPDRASGFSLNLGVYSEQSANPTLHTITNIEISPRRHSVRHTVIGNYSHENMYRHLDVPQYPDQSSIDRLQRINELPAPTNEEGILVILGDNENTQYPIYRDGAPPDTGVCTLATALYDLYSGIFSLYTSNPKLASPVMTLEM